jgi:hypothetical protein
VVVRREALARSGLFDVCLRGSEDIDLWTRLAHVGPFGCVEEVLTRVRRHAANTTLTLEFARHRVKSTRIMLERWGDDAEAAAALRRRLGACAWDLAFAEKSRGNYRQARAAYWRSALCGHRPGRALVRAAALSLLALVQKKAAAGEPGRGVEVRSRRVALASAAGADQDHPLAVAEPHAGDGAAERAVGV